MLLCLKIAGRVGNREDPDQEPRSAESDIGLHCFPMSVLWDSRHKSVKTLVYSDLYILE